MGSGCAPLNSFLLKIISFKREKKNENKTVGGKMWSKSLNVMMNDQYFKKKCQIYDNFDILMNKKCDKQFHSI